MDWFWNWGGECFGYRDGDRLFTYFGKEVGRFDSEEIYGSNGVSGRSHERQPPNHEPFQKELGEGEFWAKKERFVCPLCTLRWLRDVCRNSRIFRARTI